MPGKVLFLENDDSFSWNVIDALPVDRRTVLVRPGRSVRELPAGIEAVVVGPGPTDPERAGLTEVVGQAARAGVPLLGICLGHQALGLFFGARVVRAAPVHGKRDVVNFLRSRMFPGIVGPHTVMRYHSLRLADVPEPLSVVATNADGIPMAIEHEQLPMAGLQFHPDSFGTEGGRNMLAAFFEALR